MDINKSKITSEKAGILAIAMALLSLGVGVLSSACNNISLTWNFALEVAFGILLLLLGLLVIKIREYLKLNRWGHATIICDGTILQRFITWVEGE